MTPDKWFRIARAHRDALRSLIDRYHPQHMGVDDSHLPITAPGPEAARRNVCREIRKRTATLPKAGARFDAALKAGDTKTITILLEETWMGVPESSACWGVTGFVECVDLLDDPLCTEAEVEA